MHLLLSKSLRYARLNICLFFASLFIFTDVAGQQDSVLFPSSYLSAAEGGLVYDVSMSYKENQISGLLVAKREERGYHVVLLSKTGFKVMDFMLTPDGLVWIKTLDQLDKEGIKNALYEDFSIIYLMPLQNPEKVKFKSEDKVKIKNGNTKLAVNLSQDHQRVESAESRGFINFFKSRAVFYYTNNDNIPDEVCLTRRNLKMKIYMNLLKK